MSVNPKETQALRDDKPRLDLLEPAADEQIARALATGAERYGLRNFTESPIKARIYIGAIRRHVAAYLAGEEAAEDTGIHHLAHAGACIHVVLASIAAGTFVDDRQPNPR
jgi:hypothetical protein